MAGILSGPSVGYGRQPLQTQVDPHHRARVLWYHVLLLDQHRDIPMSGLCRAVGFLLAPQAPVVRPARRARVPFAGSGLPVVQSKLAFVRALDKAHASPAWFTSSASSSAHSTQRLMHA